VVRETDGSCARESKATVLRSFEFVFVLCVRKINVNLLAIFPNWHVKGSSYGSVRVLLYDEIPCFACQLDILGEWYVMFSVLNLGCWLAVGNSIVDDYK